MLNLLGCLLSMMLGMGILNILCNRHSIGICYEGGLDIRGRPADTRTPEQKDTLLKLLERLKTDYPQIRVVGHRDLPGVKKDCPCFEV